MRGELVKKRFWLIAPGMCAALVYGHDMYIMPSTFFPAGGATITAGFHAGDSFPESEVSGRIEKLVQPRVLWQGGEAPFANLRVAGKRVLGEVTPGGTGELIMAVNTMKALIELEPARFTAYLNEEGLADVIAWRSAHGETTRPGKERYSKYAKSLLLAGMPNAFARHAVGFTIEIVPEADPDRLKAGEPLPVQVIFRGKPAAGLQIETAWAGAAGSKTTVVGRTDADGRFLVPLTAAGKWRIHTIRMERCPEPAVADWESYWASLTLEIR
jgi:hypothetical protein